jgi:hypothetical protein
MSIGERSLSVIQPAFLNIPSPSGQALGGSFTGGTVYWTVLTNGGQIFDNEPTLVFVSVANATWSGLNAISTVNIVPNINKKLIVVLQDINNPNNPLVLVPQWQGDKIIQINVGANNNYPGSPVFNSWLVFLDVK